MIKIRHTSVCRFCLRFTPSASCKNIFESLNLRGKIFSTLSLKVQENDGLPSEICKVCSSKLNQSYLFRKQCLNSDKALRTEKKKNPPLIFSNDLQGAKESTVQCAEQKEHDNIEITFPTASVVEEILENVYLKKDLVRDEWTSIASESDNSAKKCPMLDSNTVCRDSEKENITIEEGLSHGEGESSGPSGLVKRKLRCKKNLKLIAVGKVNGEGVQANGAGKKTEYRCEFCDKTYPSVGGWRYHIHTVHSQTFQPFICDLCGKSFKAKKNLEGHKNSVHLHLKQHLCDLCGRGFSSKYGLKIHKIWHTGERNYACEICCSKFRTQSKLNAHRAVHGGPKNFICEVCSREFRWKKDFDVHLRTHTGEKPYSCLVCAKSFASITNKKKHERNHGSTATSKTVQSDLGPATDANSLGYISLCVE